MKTGENGHRPSWFCVQALTCLAETPEGRHKLQDHVDKVSRSPHVTGCYIVAPSFVIRTRDMILSVARNGQMERISAAFTSPTNQLQQSARGWHHWIPESEGGEGIVHV